jgi:hypothetical protein
MFITQFSRSLHMEHHRSGVDVLVVMPLYVVSNLFRKDAGSLFWPMPIKVTQSLSSPVPHSALCTVFSSHTRMPTILCLPACLPVNLSTCLPA